MKLIPIINFVWKTNKTTLVLILFAFVGLIFLICKTQGSIDCWYTRFLDPIASIITVIIAIVIWFYQQFNYWKESLPKRLNVHFVYDGKAVLSCFEAYLSGASDVRAWSQQIGGQMTDKTLLDFYPYIRASEPKVIKSKFETENGHSIDIMVYEAIFYLRKVDNFIRKIDDKYIVWLDNNPSKPGNIELIIDKRPDHPFSIDEAVLELNKQGKA